MPNLTLVIDPLWLIAHIEGLHRLVQEAEMRRQSRIRSSQSAGNTLQVVWPSRANDPGFCLMKKQSSM